MMADFGSPVQSMSPYVEGAAVGFDKKKRPDGLIPALHAFAQTVQVLDMY